MGWIQYSMIDWNPITKKAKILFVYKRKTTGDVKCACDFECA